MTLKPWGGYIIYNKLNSPQTLNLKPLALPKTLAKTAAVTDGWTVTFTIEGNDYVDFGNVIGRIDGAEDGLDRFDQPELPYMDGYVSMIVRNDHWPGKAMTTDLRSTDAVNGTWNLEISSKKEAGPIKIIYRIDGDIGANRVIMLVDQATRLTHPLSGGHEIVLQNYSDKFPRRLNVVAGEPQYVALAINDILSALPESFALGQNYPNPSTLTPPSGTRCHTRPGAP